MQRLLEPGALKSSVLTQSDPVRLVLDFHLTIHLYNLTLAGTSIPGVIMATTAKSTPEELENHTRIVSQLEMLLVAGWILADPLHTLPRMVAS
jgi:hypothetical protein